MRTINTTFGTFGASVLLLGLKGDSNATEILIDCAESLEEYQGTMAAVSITGPDETVYPGDISLDEDGIVHWVVAARDCGIAGNGSARVDLVDDEGTVVASAEARTIIMKTNMQGIAPDQIANWTEAASVALQEARAALLDLIDTDTTATTNEAARQLSETGRVSAETLRASAETARASAEQLRASAESARASAEQQRVSAESARASAEQQRVSAESARASAETNRVTEFNTIRTNAQAALSYIGPSEASSTASAAHAAGSYFIYNGKLYQATADIAIGDTITSGTNCAQVPGGSMGEVSNIKSAIDYPEEITFEYTSGHYINTKAAINVGDPYTSGSYTGKSTFMPCSPEDEFTISAKSGSVNNYSPWFFCDESGNILLKSSIAQCDGVVVTAPIGSAYIGITTDRQADRCYKGIMPSKRIEILDEKIAETVSGIETEIKDARDNVLKLSQFLYKENIYIDANGTEKFLNGYNTYKIPCVEKDLIILDWTGNVPVNSSINYGLVMHIQNNDDSYTAVGNNVASLQYYINVNSGLLFIAGSSHKFLVVTVLANKADSIRFSINSPYKHIETGEFVKNRNTIYKVEDEGILTRFYFGSTSIGVQTIDCYCLPVNSGDVVSFSAVPTGGYSSCANLRKSDGTVTAIARPNQSMIQTMPDDGYLSIFIGTGTWITPTVNPKKRIKIDAKSIENLTGAEYSGLNCVAFGTSLTYLASVGNGYINQLAKKSDMIIDNQGVGSSTILGDGGSLDMLAKIKSYTGYSGKRVCILEGFVNDWYGQKTLGTWTDNTETTVCGCVRSALNYMLTQNPTMTMFLILDHYGRSYNSLDCSSTVKRNNLTQYEYYSEIAKVAESLGVTVIREYALSGICELMPQYLTDNIHLTALGAEQSGNVIWEEMSKHPVCAVQ